MTGHELAVYSRSLRTTAESVQATASEALGPYEGGAAWQALTELANRFEAKAGQALVREALSE